MVSLPEMNAFVMHSSHHPHALSQRLEPGVRQKAAQTVGGIIRPHIQPSQTIAGVTQARFEQIPVDRVQALARAALRRTEDRAGALHSSSHAARASRTASAMAASGIVWTPAGVADEIPRPAFRHVVQHLPDQSKTWLPIKERLNPFTPFIPKKGKK